MKLKFLAWSFFVLCCHALLSVAPPLVTSSPQHEDFDQPKPIMQGQVHGLNGKVGLYTEGERREYEGNHAIFHSIKGQKGKGANGGANIDHRPKHRVKSSALLSAKVSFLATFTMWYVSLALILRFQFLSL